MIGWFKRNKRFEGVDQKRLVASIAALSRNEHFHVLVDHLHERRERSIRAMQVEKVVESVNRHFMEAGKLEALDELLDDLKILDNDELDPDAI